MGNSVTGTGLAALTKARRQRDSSKYLLKLYVAGVTPHSAEAIRNVSTVCEKHLHNRYELEIIDIYQQPTLARGEQIIAAPTLIRKLPLPLRRLIGNLASENTVLVGLDLLPR
ncbi:MAG: circadian clock KaiB family protein [Candidatus Omnitrophica bacterium]|nr:circadian clock KaiB family protein [Candidatus Omnitrophota bacterium]